VYYKNVLQFRNPTLPAAAGTLARVTPAPSTGYRVAWLVWTAVLIGVSVFLAVTVSVGVATLVTATGLLMSVIADRVYARTR
jgi:hypothetical protein